MQKDAIELRAKLLRKYNDLMYVQGYEQTTVRQIAEECGIGRGHLYFYFAKKEQFPIDLRRDFLYKSNLIIDREPVIPAMSKLVRFFFQILIFRNMLEYRPELFRVQANYASYPEVMDGFAQLQYDLFDTALHEAKASVPRETLEEALLSATYAEYALLRSRCIKGHTTIDPLFLYHHFNNVLFSLLDDIRPVLVAASTEAVTLFMPLRTQIMEWVYEMRGYNYAYIRE